MYKERAARAQAFRFRKAPLSTPACAEGAPSGKRAAAPACYTAAQGAPVGSEPPVRTLMEPLMHSHARPVAGNKRAASDVAVVDAAAALPAAEQEAPRKRARRKGESLACLSASSLKTQQPLLHVLRPEDPQVVCGSRR